MIEAKGHNGQVSFDGVFVTITRSGFMARASVGKGEKRIPLASVAAVQWKPAGAVTNGFIQFTVPGGNEKRSTFGHQTRDAVSDENSVLFTRKQMPQFEAFRAEIDRAIAAGHAPAAPVAAASGADEVGRLAELHRAGVLSDAEFTAAKAKALGL
jgi:hypothetical protein